MTATATPPATTETKPANPAETLLKNIGDVSKSVEAIATKLDATDKRIDELSKAQYPHGAPNGFGGFNIRKGENSMTSRPYSLARLAKALKMRNDHVADWADHAKVELDLSGRLKKSYYGGASWEGYNPGGIVTPLAAELMPTEDRTMDDGKVQKGIEVSLAKECRDIMRHDSAFDNDELSFIMKSIGLQKDLTQTNAAVGGSLIAYAAQGELIELLRATELFSRVGASSIDLPPQGKIRFPRVTGSLTIAATYEGATISESNMATGGLELSAKAYSGLTDIPDEMFRFATSVAVESWIRSEFIREIGLKADRDMITGIGGTSIRGILNYGSINTVLATTVATDGNTLGPDDPLRLYAAIADANAPIDRGFFFALTNTLWAGLCTKKASSSGDYMFAVATQGLGGGKVSKTLHGEPVFTSTQLPTNRTKGSGTTLTCLLGGVGAEWVIGRAGIVEIDMTNSDSTKFTQRISTLRGTQFVDAGPRHEASFGVVDTLLNA